MLKPTPLSHTDKNMTFAIIREKWDKVKFVSSVPTKWAPAWLPNNNNILNILYKLYRLRLPKFILCTPKKSWALTVYSIHQFNCSLAFFLLISWLLWLSKLWIMLEKSCIQPNPNPWSSWCLVDVPRCGDALSWQSLKCCGSYSEVFSNCDGLPAMPVEVSFQEGRRKLRFWWWAQRRFRRGISITIFEDNLTQRRSLAAVINVYKRLIRSRLSQIMK